MDFYGYHYKKSGLFLLIVTFEWVLLCMIWFEIEGNNVIDLSHPFSGPQGKLLSPPANYCSISLWFYLRPFDWLILNAFD